MKGARAKLGEATSIQMTNEAIAPLFLSSSSSCQASAQSVRASWSISATYGSLGGGNGLEHDGEGMRRLPIYPILKISFKTLSTQHKRHSPS